MKYIIRTDGDSTPYYIVKSTRSRSGYAWKKGEPGRQNAHCFADRAEAEWLIDHGFNGAGGGNAVVCEVAE